MDRTMTDTSNVVPMEPPAPRSPDGGVAQQRYRRKQTKPRKPRAKSSPSGASKTADTTAKATVPPDAFIEENTNSDNNMVSSSGGLPRYASHDAVRRTPNAEFRSGDVRHDGGKSDALDWLARAVAVGMACITAYFSIHGLLTLFPGDEIGVVVFGIGVECLKVVGVMYLSAHARSVWWLWRVTVILAVIIAAGLNSASVYAKFASLHASSPAAAAAVREGDSGAADARIEYLTGRVADLTTQIRQADDAITTATQRGRRNEADDRRRTRTTLAGQRDAASSELASLKAKRSGLTAAGHQAAAEELPVTLMASLLTVDAATVLRWLVCAVVICGDPAALVLLAAVGSRRRRG
jgi:hypothetical protein